MKGRSTTLEALSCISEMQPGSIALNVKFIRETARDAYGHLKEFCKIKAENSSLRTTVRRQKAKLLDLQIQCCVMEHTLGIPSRSKEKRCKLRLTGGSMEACQVCPHCIKLGTEKGGS